MTTFTTTIVRMFTVQQPDPDYVVNVTWTVTGVDGDNAASIDGSTSFDSSQQEGPVTPYADLTPELVASWIPDEQIVCAQANVQGQIDSMINPPASPQNTPLPWSQD